MRFTFQRLSDALARRGHTVDVIHDRDAYYLARRPPPGPSTGDHPNVHVHGLKSRFGILSPILPSRPVVRGQTRCTTPS